MKKILILGASGLIGYALCETLSQNEDYQVFGTYCSNKRKPDRTMMVKLDIAHEDAIIHVLETVEPDVVISSLRGDFIYQLEAHRRMAEFLKESGGRLYYLSSANVFDAFTNKAHVESDETGSISEYGQFKIRCEKMLHQIMGPSVTLLRLPMTFGKDSDRLKTIKDGLTKGNSLVIYRDYYLNLHSDRLLAEQIAFLVDNHAEGILHLGSHDVVGYDEAMALLLKQLGFDNPRFQFERIQDQPYYMALTTEKNLLPVDLMCSAEQVIESILH